MHSCFRPVFFFKAVKELHALISGVLSIVFYSLVSDTECGCIREKSQMHLIRISLPLKKKSEDDLKWHIKVFCLTEHIATKHFKVSFFMVTTLNFKDVINYHCSSLLLSVLPTWDFYTLFNSSILLSPSKNTHHCQSQLFSLLCEAVN